MLNGCFRQANLTHSFYAFNKYPRERQLFKENEIQINTEFILSRHSGELVAGVYAMFFFLVFASKTEIFI